MDEYKSSDDNIFCKNRYHQLIFTKLDIDDDDSTNDDEIFEIENLNIEKLINSIQEAISYNNDDDIESTIFKLYKYLDNTDISTQSLLQNSNIIPILIDQLARNLNDYLDKIILSSIKCLHKIILKSQILESIAIKNNITFYINIILKFPVCPSTEYALCILINILSDNNEYVPHLIDYFTPSLFLDLFKERLYEKGWARLIAQQCRNRLTPKICKLFLQYSTIVLKDEYIQSILSFFDSLIYQENTNESFFLSVLNPIRGIIELFSTNKVDFNYLRNKAFHLFNIILNALNFFQRSNKFEEMSEFIELAACIIYLGGNCDEEPRNLFIQIILNSIQNECKLFKINSFNFFNVIIEKKWIFFSDEFLLENTIIGILCNSVENDPYAVACEAFSVLKNIIKIVDSSRIKELLIDDVFQSIFKIIQSGDQNLTIDSVSSFLTLYEKSRVLDITELFLELLKKNESQIDEIFELESESDLDSTQADFLRQFYEIINSVKKS